MNSIYQYWNESLRLGEAKMALIDVQPNVVNSFDTIYSKLFPSLNQGRNIKARYIPRKVVSTTPTETIEGHLIVNSASKMFQSSNIEFTGKMSCYVIHVVPYFMFT